MSYIFATNDNFKRLMEKSFEFHALNEAFYRKMLSYVFQEIETGTWKYWTTSPAYCVWRDIPAEGITVYEMATKQCRPFDEVCEAFDELIDNGLVRSAGFTFFAKDFPAIQREYEKTLEKRQGWTLKTLPEREYKKRVAAYKKREIERRRRRNAKIKAARETAKQATLLALQA